MDLLGDLGTQDQLTAAREENALLHVKVKELTARAHVLTIENESLKAEVDMYRQDALSQRFVNQLNVASSSSSGVTQNDTTISAAAVAATTLSSFEATFVRAGNGVYPNTCHVSLSHLHNATNPLCCCLSPDETVLATGGANATVRLCLWGTAYDVSSHEEEATRTAILDASATVQCSAPVTAVAFAPSSSSLPRVVACACMDGSVVVIQYETYTQPAPLLEESDRSSSSTTRLRILSQQTVCQHAKYVRTLVWKQKTDSDPSSSPPILATASADGVIYLHKVERNKYWMMNDDSSDDSNSSLTVTRLTSWHLSGAVESLCFVNHDRLLCYVRDSPHVTLYNLNDDKQPATTIHLNASPHDTHVSFCIMNMSTYHQKNQNVVAAATDHHRNFILDVSSNKIVRNFYGHANDGYSQPKIAWSHSGQYVLGNTSDDGCVVVWDVASSSIVDRLKTTHHAQPVRDLYASPTSDTLVTTSFDKRTNLWFYDDDKRRSDTTTPTIPMSRTSDSQEDDMME